MTLRARLIALLMAVTTLALAIVVSVGVLTLRAYLTDRLDGQLEIIAEFVRARQDEILANDPEALIGDVSAPRELLVEIESDAVVHRDPTFDSSLLDAVTGRVDEGAPRTVGHEGSSYRVMYMELPRHEARLVVALSLEPVEAAVRRLVLTGAVTSVLLLAVFGSVASSVLRWGLRPLDDVVDTAEAIADGDTDRRVPVDPSRIRTETGRLTVSINRMLAHLQAAIRSRTESEERMRRFAADASHELRTPLTVVRGYLQMLAEGVVTMRDRPDVVPRAQAEAERMSRLVENLLYLSRLDERAGSAPSARPSAVSLAELVRDCVSDAHAAAPERLVRTDVRDECLVTGDRDSLHQALANVLANVLTHTPSDSDAVVRLERVDGRAVLEVSDSGPGIGPESSVLAFERFYRDPSAHEREGSGLGLSIVRAVMASHGGNARLRSTVEEGTTVTLVFPLRGADPEGGGDAHLTPPDGFSADSHPPRRSSSSGHGGLDPWPAVRRAGGRNTTRERRSMATLLYRIGSFSYRRRWWVLGAWLALIAVAATAALTFRTPMSDTFEIPGTESQEAADMLAERFPERGGGTVTVVVRAPEGEDLTDSEEYREAVGATAEELRGIEGVEGVTNPFGLLSDAREAYGDALAEAEREARDLARQEAGAQVPEGTPGREDVIARAEEEAASRVAEESPAFDEEEALGRIPLFSDSQRALLLQVQLEEPDGDVDQDTVEAVLDSGGAARDAGLTVEHSGQSLSMGAPVMGAGEALGVVVALIVLILNFGALVLAGMPILIALAGVGLGMASVFSLASVLELTSTAPILAVMIGIAVGIDYSLFVLSRHRQQLAEGMDPHESAARAIGTAGSAVVFAGITVMIALVGLNVVGVPFLGVMGVVASVTVFTAVLGAVTLLPALLGFLGTRIGALRLPVLGRRSEASLTAGETLSGRWARLLVRHPVLPVVAVVLALGAAALPAADLRLGLPNDSTAAEDTTQRRAYEIVSEEFGPGYASPLLLVADLRDASDREAAAEEIAERAEGLDGVEDVYPPAYNGSGDTAIITVVPEEGPSSTATEDLLHDIRDERGAMEADTGAAVSVTGATAAGIDISERLNEALPLFLGIVVGLALILMMLVFRSVLVPLKAALGFVLSAGAALGLTVAVFQQGHGAELLNVESSPTLLAFLPILLLGVLFGLAIDYEVFLVSRMREEFTHGAEAREAVVTGFRQGARVVTVAAVIMVSVFGSFVFGHDEMIKPIAFALAVGVLVDAFLVRMTLVPALMSLFGRAAWWLPRWLGRLLPPVDIEGEKLARAFDPAPETAGTGTRR
ncbi:putative membrane protein YdfJ with MMPL/SSD domain/signal transduction histidine kinase [Nocardiopsis arvandica]|uniref:histidine kinase n=1 Tax=Nocardiopsis sinuspersici TaxID=501010 RepID=A0A7Y9X7V5_9ACTN|nr:putative membrane protein YdfJ with MMPL/SSD domain/signal transduction histidine kinase [Nocardiopsis sinuspersici]